MVHRRACFCSSSSCTFLVHPQCCDVRVDGQFLSRRQSSRCLCFLFGLWPEHTPRGAYSTCFTNGIADAMNPCLRNPADAIATGFCLVHCVFHSETTMTGSTMVSSSKFKGTKLDYL